MKLRKKQPAATRRAILEAAGAEFAVHGYAGTGLGAIVTRAGLTKGALFHHFKDKEAMAEAWIEELLSSEIGHIWVDPMAEIVSLDSLRSFLRVRCIELQSGDSTSALVALTAGADDANGPLTRALERIFASWRGALANLLEQGKGAGWIHRSIQPTAEAAFMVSWVAGLSLTCRAGDTDSTRRSAVDALEGYLETLRAH